MLICLVLVLVILFPLEGKLGSFNFVYVLLFIHNSKKKINSVKFNSANTYIRLTRADCLVTEVIIKGKAVELMTGTPELNFKAGPRLLFFLYSNLKGKSL